jgi:hypothetical protein
MGDSDIRDRRRTVATCTSCVVVWRVQVLLYPRPELKSVIVYLSFLQRELSKLPRTADHRSERILTSSQI